MKIETKDWQGPKEDNNEAEQHNMIITVKRMHKFQALNISRQAAAVEDGSLSTRRQLLSEVPLSLQ